MGKSDLTLNAGSGADTWGSLRVDIQTFSDVYYRKKTSVNIVASIEYLPFKSKIFDKVRCYHVLEHTDRPRECYKELRRVTKGSLRIRVPVHHLYSFTIDAVSLLRYFLMIPFIGISAFKDHLYKVRSWKIRYSGHRWYIKGRKINRVYWILPLEYEINYYNCVNCYWYQLGECIINYYEEKDFRRFGRPYKEYCVKS